jgi:biopolymer transport protein ExbD
MLDVVFNILAFFVMTFSPPEAERNFDVNLPPPKLQQGAPAEGQGPGELPTEEPQLFQDLSIFLTAGPDGSLAGIRLEQKNVGIGGPGGMGGLARELRATAGAMRGASKEKLETANIIASGKLKYQYLIAAVDACYQADIKKINFSEPAAGNP